MEWSLSRPVARLILPVLLAFVLASGPLATVHGASSLGTVTRGGLALWRISQVRALTVAHLPNVHWWGDKAGFHEYIFLLRITNLGHRVVAPSDDLSLTMKVMQPTQAKYPAGWSSHPVPQDKNYAPLTRGAIRLYGGVAPWIAERPGQTLTYCYVFGAYPGDTHYGMYNVEGGNHPTSFSQWKFLFSTGL